MTTRRRGASASAPLMPVDEGPRLVLIDGNALVHRSYRAISIRGNLTVGSTGEDITGVYGFTNTFLRAIQDHHPTHCAITFDLPAPTFRHKMFAEYKAQRPPTPPELRSQFDRVRQLMQAFRVPIFETEGYEADDVLGTLSLQAQEQEVPTVILTGDTDTLQLVSPWVKVAMHSGVQDKRLYDEAEVKARFFGLAAEQQPDFKALKGDSSDNIPGVPGIGDKTAARLLLEYGTLEGLYKHVEAVTPPKTRQALEQHRERALQGKVLTTIVRDVPVTLDMDQVRFWTYSRQDIVDFMRELEFLTIIPRIPEPPLSEKKKSAVRLTEQADALNYAIVDEEGQLSAMCRELAAAPRVSFDTETSGLDPMKADLVGLSFATEPGKAWYVPVGHREGKQLPMEQVLAQLKPIMESPQVSKVAHNCTFDMTILEQLGIRTQGMDFDTMVASQMSGKKTIGLKELVLDVLGVEMTKISDLIGTGSKQVSFDRLPIDERVRDYACADADLPLRLVPIFDEALHQDGVWDLFEKVEMPLAPVIVDMQRNGIEVEEGMLHEMARDINEQLHLLETQVYNDAGRPFNINSPQQLSQLLFEELKLGPTKRTRTGAYTTDAQTLENLKGHHPVIDGILEYRQLSKLKGTYVDALPELINRRTRRIHTSFNQVGSATGRMSSSDPNLQNIPIRTELGRQVRRAFIAPRVDGEQWHLLSADYSQIELRVLAHLSEDPALLEAFRNGEDIHTATASTMFDVPFSEVNSDHRRIAKVLNFGVIYGLSAYGISQQTEFGPEEGTRFIESYFSKYPGIRGYLDGIKEQARARGYVETALWRRRYIPELNASNRALRMSGERMAINMPIQGTAADIMKLAMLRVARRMKEEGLRSRLLLQVHDELMFEAPDGEIGSLRELVLQEMPDALREMPSAPEFAVPLNVEVKTGSNWGDME